MADHKTPTPSHAPSSPLVDTHGVRHDHTTCAGCDHIFGIDDLVAVLGQPKHTLYKRSRRSFPGFPRRLQDRAAIAVRCVDAKIYLAEVAR